MTSLVQTYQLLTQMINSTKIDFTNKCPQVSTYTAWVPVSKEITWFSIILIIPTPVDR